MTAEQALVHYLEEAGGALFDADGQAVSRIATALGTSPQRTSVLLTAMEDHGQIALEAEEQRIYLVILRGFGEQSGRAPDPVQVERDDYRFQVEQLQARVEHLEAELITEKEQRRHLAMQMITERERAERAERNCERMRQNLMRAQDQLRRGRDTIRELITEKERNDLDRFMREVPSHH